MKQFSFLIAISATIFLFSCNNNKEVNRQNTIQQETQISEVNHADGDHEHLHSTDKTYNMKFTTTPATINEKQNVTLILRPEQIGKTSDLIPLEVVHEKKIHLILVSSDLSWFDHIHPLVDKDNNYVVDTKFPYGGSFILFADYKPEGASQQLTRIPITVEGYNKEARKYSKQNLAWKGDGGYEVSMTFNNTEIKAGEAQMPTFNIKKNGKEVKDLEHYLGALGHLVIISENTQNYLHAHPMDDDAHGPSVVFHTEFESAGVYRTFLQFNHAGKIHTADFVVVAK